MMPSMPPRYSLYMHRQEVVSLQLTKMPFLVALQGLLREAEAQGMERHRL